MNDLKRKILAVLACLVTLLLLLLHTPADFTDLVKIVDGKYSFFYDGEAICSLDTLRNGCGTIVNCGLEDVSQTPVGFRGASVTFDGDSASVSAWLKKLSVKVTFSEEVDGIVCVYGYSPRLKGGVEVDGQTVNVQIALNGGRVHLGTPLLLGSY